MARPWDVEIAVTEPMARELIERQFPALAPVTAERLGVGWDNAAFLVHAALGDFVFRFPQRAVAAPLMSNELRALPALAPYLPMPVPAAIYVGAPDAEYPYAFGGSRHIPGITACAVSWSDAERADNAAALGGFLRALHYIPLSAEVPAPSDSLGHADLAKRVPLVKGWLAEIDGAVAGLDVRPHLALADRLTHSPPAPEACWVHGDLYARHLLVDGERRLCGVIDWGDMHGGDPALDLSICFSFLPPEARDAFRHAYGSIDNAAWDRARLRSLHHGAALVRYGLEVGDSDIRVVGEYALASVLK